MRVGNSDSVSLPVDELVIHEDFACNHCKKNPITGVRFSSKTEEDKDYCETCFDATQLTTDGFKIFDKPESFGGDIVHHDLKCANCSMKPIIGPAVVCTECKRTSLC